MFERYTDRARRVIVLADQAARDLGHGAVDTGHLLLGLLGEGEATAFRALDALGVTQEAARAAVLARRPAGPAETGGHIPFTPPLKKALDLGLRESLRLGCNFIAPEHLLLGLIREGGDIGALALADCGIADGDRGFLADVRAKALELIGGNAKPAAAGGEAAVVLPEIVRIGPPLPGPLMCFRCLTGTCGCVGEVVRSDAHGNGMVPAVTMHAGTALCLDCADKAPVF